MSLSGGLEVRPWGTRLRPLHNVAAYDRNLRTAGALAQALEGWRHDHHFAYLGQMWQSALPLPALDPAIDAHALAAHWAGLALDQR